MKNTLIAAVRQRETARVRTIQLLTIVGAKPNCETCSKSKHWSWCYCVHLWTQRLTTVALIGFAIISKTIMGHPLASARVPYPFHSFKLQQLLTSPSDIIAMSMGSTHQLTSYKSLKLGKWWKNQLLIHWFSGATMGHISPQTGLVRVVFQG